MRQSYRDMQATAHQAGGETQTEACERMSDAVLNGRSRSHIMWLNALLPSLYKEAAACTSEEQYAPVRVQINRVRAALAKNDAL